MTNDKQFKLDGDLEQLINRFDSADTLSKLGRTDPKLDNYELRTQAERFYGDGMMTEYSPNSFLRELRNGRLRTLQDLDTKVNNDTFNTARQNFTKGLDEEIKTNMYLEMLREGIMPNPPKKEANQKDIEAYNSLALAKRTLDFAENLEIHAQKGDVDGALNEIASYAKTIGKKPSQVFTQQDLDSLTIYKKYGAPAARDNEKQLLGRIANIHRSYAANLIKEKNLYGLIDNGIENTQYGKAIALKSMYEANTTQERRNKENEAKVDQRKAA